MPVSQEYFEQAHKIARETAPGSSISPSSSTETYHSDYGFANVWTSNSASSLHSVSEQEKRGYYSHLPTRPKLVFRSGTSPSVVLQLGPVYDHRIIAVWTVLGPLVVEHLDAAEVMWTSIDGVRFNKIGEAPGPVVLWIGVVPDSLPWERAQTAALGCLALLKQFDITDVEVDFRESLYTRLVGRMLLEPADDDDPIRDFRAPLTPVLGLHIADTCAHSAGGTGGLYIAEGGDSTRLFLLTARHIFPSLGEDHDFASTTLSNSQPRPEILLLGGKMFQNYIDHIKTKLEELRFNLRDRERHLALWMEEPAENGRDEEAPGRADTQRRLIQRRLQREMGEAKVMIDGLDKLHDEAVKNWSDETQRVLGPVVCSPPLALGVGAEGYTEDYAVVELDSDKFKGKHAFHSNAIDLGIKIRFTKLSTMMSSESPADGTFKYPLDRLLKLGGLIEEDKLRYPETFDHEGKHALSVLKNGAATGLTIGRATGVFSFVREYLSDRTRRTSLEWALLPYDKDAGPFAAAGDSGAIIADGRGLIGGLLTGGSTADDELGVDIAYATPMAWLFERFKANGFPDAHLDPVILPRCRCVWCRFDNAGPA